MPWSLIRPRSVVFAAYAVFCLAIFFWTARYSIFRWDGAHWGSILTHSLSICEGNAPYREVPIYYGPLLFYIICAVGSVTEFSYLSIGLLTGLAYTANVGFCLLIASRLGCRVSTQIIFLLIVFLLHPYTPYPWYDYFAGVFLTGGIYFLLHASSGRAQYALIGKCPEIFAL